MNNFKINFKSTILYFPILQSLPNNVIDNVSINVSINDIQGSNCLSLPHL